MTRDAATVEGFGFEWTTFDQSALTSAEALAIFDSYFALFPWNELPDDAIGIDVGTGSGRWAALVRERVGGVVALDPAYDAVRVASRACSDCLPVAGAAGQLPFRDKSFDFGFSLGVLHHVPDTIGALADAIRTLKHGAPFLLYLYYAFDNQPVWYRAIWKLSDLSRQMISRLPDRTRYLVSQVIAGTVYYPLARTARVAERLGLGVGSWPLSGYRDRSWYVMRTDALDRFGTRLEKRFTRIEIDEMMAAAGLQDIRVSSGFPYWCALGRRSDWPDDDLEQ